ncbi:MAG: hypothetical protein ABIH23_06255 [bacterium]
MKHTYYIRILLVFSSLFTLWNVSNIAFAEETFTVSRGVRQIFLDDAGIASMEGLVRVVHQPDRYPNNPVLTPDTPWESRCQVYGTAYYDEALGRFRMWYLTTPRDRGLKPLDMGTHERAPHTTLAAYAESEDGIHWIKPNLEIFPYDGDRQNNLLGFGRYNCDGISGLHEPSDRDPKRRWKAVYWDHGSGDWEVLDGKPYAKPGPFDGFYVAFSPDGIHWNSYKDNPVLRKYCDTNQNVVYDPNLKKYVAFSRFGFGRKLARSESEDFLHWTEPQLVLECDEQDGPNTQIYGAGVDLYESLYLAMIWMYREGGDGKIDTQLAVSRDGFHWTRVANRATWLALGDDDSWEGGMVRSVERIIRRGDTLYIYYCGVHGAHTGPMRETVERKYPTAIGLLTLRRDGFVSLQAEESEGILLTQPFSLPEGNLYLNANAESGSISTALCDSNGEPILGFEESQTISGDTLQSAVKWKKEVPSELLGRQACLRISIRNADLYSYWWE